MRRDSAPSRQTREGVAGGIEIGSGVGRFTDVNPTLDARATQGVVQPIAFHPTQDPISSTDGSTHAMGAGNGQGCATVAVAQPIPLDLRNAGRDPEKHDEVNRQGVGVGEAGDPAHTITTACVHGVATSMAVRRLTPVECERLQGFPDGYTNIPWRGKPESPDGPRYKALGNSWAVPVVRWIGGRIHDFVTNNPLRFS